MKNSSRLLLGTTVLAVALSASFATAQENDPNTIIAVINGKPIPALRLSLYATQGGRQQDVVQNAIASELIAQAARKAGMDQDPETAQRLIIAEQNVLGGLYTQKFIAEHPVTEEDVQARYDLLKEQAQGEKEYKSSHILVETEDLAREIYDQVAEDADDFADLAKEHSTDTGSGAKGGDLGWVHPDALVPEYADALRSTPPGELAVAPVRSQFGWHIIMVTDARPVTVPELSDQMRQQINRAIQIEIFTKHLAELEADATITRPLAEN